MKYKKMIIVALSAIFLIAAITISGGSSIKYFLAGILFQNNENNNNILFSKESGFYNEDFELLLFAPTNEIYYTLDGSDPTKDSLKYDGKIKIDDASNHPNIYSSRTDVTAAFLEEQVKEYCEEKRIITYHVPEDNVDKCTIVKAIYYDKDDNPSEIAERIYFIDFQNKDGYDDINIISITTDPENLFGYESGIYTLGKSYDAGVLSGMFEDDFTKGHWWFWNANYRNKGRKWERECRITVFNEDKQLVLTQNAGVRIQGGGSRGFLPKSLNLYARDEYGDNRFRYDFWDTGYEPKRMTLSSGGDDYDTKVKDRLISELCKDNEISTMHYEPYILFLNGEYWGFYYLTEKYDENYLEYYYHVNKNEVVMVKNYEFETGIEEEFQSYNSMVAFVTQNDMSDDNNYQKACEILDMNSFIDYFAMQTYIARRGDWPKGNFALWRSCGNVNSGYEDGKWRWMLFDVNSAAMGDVDYDSIAMLLKESDLFGSLCNSVDFKKAFSKRLLEIADECFDVEKVNNKLNTYIELMEDPMKKHYERFFGTSNEDFYKEIENMKCFFNEREDYIVDFIKVNFGEEYL